MSDTATRRILFASAAAAAAQANTITAIANIHRTLCAPGFIVILRSGGIVAGPDALSIMHQAVLPT